VLWAGTVAGLLLMLGPDNVYTDIAVFFSKMATVTLGGAYAVLASVDWPMLTLVIIALI